MKTTIEELKRLQSQTLDTKITMTRQRIREWITYWGEDGVYVAFSGGKDSTVLLDIVRRDYPNVPAVFVDTGLEYPEIREFVKSYENVIWVKPKMNFRQVIEKYGYPIISKEISDCISLAQRGYKSGLDKLNGVDKKGEKSDFRKGFMKWKFLLDAPFKVSDECCWKNKKEPSKCYEKQSGRKPMLGMTAEESVFRKTAWLETGCNSFKANRPLSSPMAFWLEQDILQYIKRYDLKICSVYGDVVEDMSETGDIEGQLFITELDCMAEENNISKPEPKLKTTLCDRTGCVFCLFGIHLEKSPNRLERLKITHPKLYDYVMRPESEGGLGYKEKIDWLNEHGKMKIKY